jgi:hypothetical protein
MKLAFVCAFAIPFKHTNNLNLNINLDEAFAERVDLNKTRVDSAIETAKFGDQANIALRDRFVGVRTDDTAGDGTHSSNT